jgi:hypothetical protein
MSMTASGGVPRRLKVRSPETLRGMVVPIRAGRSVVGRAADAGMRIDHPDVSRTHAAIEHQAGRTIVEDLGSTNGTTVNGIVVDRPRQLHHGDVLRFGSVAAVFEELRTPNAPTGAHRSTSAGATAKTAGDAEREPAVGGPARPPSQRMTRQRAMLIGLAVAAALAVVVPLGLGTMPAWSQIPALFGACALIAVVAFAFPMSLRKRFAPLVATFVSAVGLLSLFIRPAEDDVVSASRSTDAQYLAELVVREPFTEELPDPLIAEGFDSVEIADSSAALKLSAAELEVASGPGELGNLDSFFAHVEVYPSPEDAADRAAASMDRLTELHETGIERQSPQSFCVYSDDQNFWTCAGQRGYFYAEVTVSPAANAFLPYATDSVDALLRHGDRITRLATNL